MKDRPGYFETLRIIEEMNLLQIALFMGNLCLCALYRWGKDGEENGIAISYRAEFTTAMMDRFVKHGTDEKLNHQLAVIALHAIIEYLFTIRDFVGEDDWKQFMDFFAASFTAYVKDPKPTRPYEHDHAFPPEYIEQYKAGVSIYNSAPAGNNQTTENNS